jgi:hypothetical protein
MLGLTEMHRHRDRRFGNGRAVRNLFEQAIRRMANRIADLREITAEQLMLLEMDDIEFNGLPAELNLDSRSSGKCRFHVVCPKCSYESKAPGMFLGKRVRCPKCQTDFLAEWGEPVAADSK